MTQADQGAGAATHCPYCALQCAMTVSAGDPLGATPEIAGRNFPTNRGGLCKKGWTAAELLVSSQRILEPMIREGDGFRAASWDEALEVIATRLTEIRAESGADAVGVFGGGGLTNEKAYQLGKFARLALGTSRIDYNGRFCMSSAAAAANRAFGLDRGLPFPVEHLDEAQTILLLGSNVAETMPPFIGHLGGARAAGGLIVVDPRRSATARLTADGGGIHLQPAPGTDLALLLGLTHLVIDSGLADRDYLGTRTTGFDRLRRSVSSWWPERVQQTTGVPVSQLRQVAARLSSGRGSYILTGRGVEQHVDGTDTATAAINLALVLGLVGTTHSGYGTLTGQGNGQGGREHGQKCDQLPGYRKIADPDDREHVAGVWGVPAASLPGPGLPAVELLASIGQPDGIRALLVHGSNVVVSAPDSASVRAGLESLDLLVVCDFFFSETAAFADVVLPVTQWAEEEGTMTSLEGRVLRRRQAITPPPGVRSELWIMHELAERLDAPGTYSIDAAEVFDELARASAGGLADYSGLSHDLLDSGVAAFWPYPPESTGTPRMFLDAFPHPDGKAKLVPVRVRSRPKPDGSDTMTLITGRLLGQYQSGTQTRRVPELLASNPHAEAELHPAAAARLGLADGDPAELFNDRGTVRCRVKVTADIRYDTVFLPFHYSNGESANLLTEAATDPVSGMPEFKSTHVGVRAVSDAEKLHAPAVDAHG